MKILTLLGSTGSIGCNTLDVVRKHPTQFKVRFLTVHSKVDELAKQVDEFKPEAVVVTNKAAFEQANQQIKNTRVLYGTEELIRIAGETVDICVNALVGAAGVRPTLNAIKNGIDIALANKETLVTAGTVITAEAKKANVNIFPIDSEHSAIWQCLVGEDMANIANIIVTASGGPFRGQSRAQLENATIKQALAHPNWSMGSKITIDSASLMNKGFEVIETYWLYKTKIESIKVVVHPQSIIHSMVEFVDGSFKAQLGVPDMRVPIQYALTYPNRLPLTVEPLNFAKLKQLTFEEPDLDTFKCLKLAYNALKENGTMPAVLNAANEVTNQAFLEGKIAFNAIGDLNETTMLKHTLLKGSSIDEILDADAWARDFTAGLIKG